MPSTLIAGRLSPTTPLRENSGLDFALRPENAGLLLGHNDSGGKAEVYAIDRNARPVGVIAVSGAVAVDWEDISTWRAPSGVAHVYVADTGDNVLRRRVVSVYRFAEPVIRDGSKVVVAADKIPVVYRTADTSGGHQVSLDVEAFGLSTGGDGWFVSKRMHTSGKVRWADAYIARGLGTASKAMTAEYAVSFQVPLEAGKVGPTGLDITSTLIVVRCLQALLVWHRKPGEGTEQVWLSRPVPDLVIPGGYGESVAADDGRLWVIPEGASAPLYVTTIPE